MPTGNPKTAHTVVNCSAYTVRSIVSNFHFGKAASVGTKRTYNAPISPLLALSWPRLVLRAALGEGLLKDLNGPGLQAGACGR